MATDLSLCPCGTTDVVACIHSGCTVRHTPDETVKDNTLSLAQRISTNYGYKEATSVFCLDCNQTANCHAARKCMGMEFVGDKEPVVWEFSDKDFFPDGLPNVENKQLAALPLYECTGCGWVGTDADKLKVHDGDVTTYYLCPKCDSEEFYLKD